MLPVLIRFEFHAAWAQLVLFALAVGVVVYAAWSGWRGAAGVENPKTGELAPPAREDQVERALLFGGLGVLVALIGIFYALPQESKAFQSLFRNPWSSTAPWWLAALAVLGASWVGWRRARSKVTAKGKERPLEPQERLASVARYAAVAAVVCFGVIRMVLPRLTKSEEGIPLHTYGLLLAAGFLSAVSVAGRLAVREWRGEEGLRMRDQIFDMAFWVLLSGVVGSRVLFILVNWKQYARDPSQLFSLSGGLVFYGALIGATLGVLLYSRIHQLDFLRIADVCMPTVSLGQCFGRMGCFSAGCCWGDIAGSHYAWGANFPGLGLVKDLFGRAGGVASNAFQSQLEDKRWVLEQTGEVFHHAVPGAVQISQWAASHGHTLPVHPTQIYESVGQLVLFVGLMVLRQYRRFHGQILGVWLMAYAVLRTSVELFRGDLERGTLNGLLHGLGWTSVAQKVPPEAWYNVSTSQFISICLFSLGAALLYRQGRNVAWGAQATSAAHAA